METAAGLAAALTELVQSEGDRLQVSCKTKPGEFGDQEMVAWPSGRGTMVSVGGSGDLPGLAWCSSLGRRRFQRPGKNIAERLGRPAAKALDLAGHNVERTRREARLDADDGIDGPPGSPACVSPTPN